LLYVLRFVTTAPGQQQQFEDSWSLLRMQARVTEQERRFSMRTKLRPKRVQILKLYQAELRSDPLIYLKSALTRSERIEKFLSSYMFDFVIFYRRERDCLWVALWRPAISHCVRDRPSGVLRKRCLLVCLGRLRGDQPSFAACGSGPPLRLLRTASNRMFTGHSVVKPEGSHPRHFAN
jgi:hypothetical protein